MTNTDLANKIAAAINHGALGGAYTGKAWVGRDGLIARVYVKQHGKKDCGAVDIRDSQADYSGLKCGSTISPEKAEAYIAEEMAKAI